jgi:hypothetical protein
VPTLNIFTGYVLFGYIDRLAGRVVGASIAAVFRLVAAGIAATRAGA